MPAFDQTFENTIYYSNSNNSIISDSNPIENISPVIVSILHFNDCYNVESRSQEPSGGAPRMVTAFKSFSHCNPLILFSGDIMAPSISQYSYPFTTIPNFMLCLIRLVSTFTKGEQMVPVLNALDIDCAVFGNHEFGMCFTKYQSIPSIL